MAMWVLKKFRLVILIWHQHHVDFHQRHVESPGVMLIWHQHHVDFHWNRPELPGMAWSHVDLASTSC